MKYSKDPCITFQIICTKDEKIYNKLEDLIQEGTEKILI